MSLIPANIEYLAFAVQADKVTAASAPTIACSLQDCSVEPNPTTIVTAESDRSAQQGNKVVVGAQPGGSFKKYVRPSEEDFFLNALLGKTTDGGTTPKTHTSEVDSAAPFTTPYLTVWDVWPGVATTRYDGVRIGSASFSGQPGGAIEVEYELVARKATLGVSEPNPAGLITSEAEMTWPELAATLGGSDPGTVNQFSLKIDRNTGRFTGDNGFTDFDLPNGLLAVTGNIEIAFEDDDLYRAANTGTTSGTVLTTTVFDEALVIDLLRSSLLEVKFTMAGVQVTNYKVALKTDASPAVATFDFNSKRQATISDAIQTLVKNAITHADRS